MQELVSDFRNFESGIIDSLLQLLADVAESSSPAASNCIFSLLSPVVQAPKSFLLQRAWPLTRAGPWSPRGAPLPDPFRGSVCCPPHIFRPGDALEMLASPHVNYIRNKCRSNDVLFTYIHETSETRHFRDKIRFHILFWLCSYFCFPPIKFGDQLLCSASTVNTKLSTYMWMIGFGLVSKVSDGISCRAGNGNVRTVAFHFTVSSLFLV